MLLSVVISYQGISKLKRENIWELRNKIEEYHGRDHWFQVLTRVTVLFIDSLLGKITVLVLLVAIPYACGRLAFEFDYLYTGLFALLAVAAYFSWIAIAVRIFGAFMPVIRM
jgi:hypothetical protein